MFNSLFKFGMPMFDEDGGTGGGAASAGTEDKGDKGTKTDENFIPKSRFDEVNKKYKEMKSQFDEFLTAKEAAETEAKKKSGQFEDLYAKAKTDLEKTSADVAASKGRVETLEALITSMLNAKLETVPEEFRDLVPSDMAPEQKLNWLSQAEAKGLFGATKKSEQPVGGSTNPTGKQVADLSTLSPMDLLKSAYSKR